MENTGSCQQCRKRTLASDVQAGILFCSSCGFIQELGNLEHYLGGLSGPVGTFVRTGTAGSGSVYCGKERKIHKAIQSIESISSKLSFNDSRKEEVRMMVENLTEGEFGEGYWLPVLIGACSYVVMRKDSKCYSLAEVAVIVDCDIYELGRMVNRVVAFLELTLPQLDIVYLVKRAVHTCFNAAKIYEDKIGRMIKQGTFLVQCLVKWYLTTGRRPLPVVVAVIVLVAQLNEVDVKIDDVAKKLHVAVATSRLRYNEILERLVEVAQALPWGKDITVKNIVKNAPFVIQYMEVKSLSKHGQQSKGIEPVLFDVDDLVGDCLSKEIEYGGMGSGDVVKDTQYFELEGKSSSPRWNSDDLEKFKISHECLSMVYSQFSNEVFMPESAEETGNDSRRRGFDLSECREWWTGKSELCKKLFLKEILEKDIGLNAMPPSFVSGCLANDRRREKIKAAKLRISKVMHPRNSSSVEKDNQCLTEGTSARKRRKRKRKGMNVDTDWEDFIIETLLLHQVGEEEIEKGHYNTLLDLHVFSSGNMS